MKGWLTVAAMTCVVISAAVLLTFQSTTAIPQSVSTVTARNSVFVPAVTEVQLISGALAPPPESACFAIGIRCFTPQSMTAGYNFGPLYAAGDNGAGKTIAIIDSFGSPTIADDLHVFDSAFGLQPMCGNRRYLRARYADLQRFGSAGFTGTPSSTPQ